MAIFYVTTLDDDPNTADGNLSLREAIALAETGSRMGLHDVIRFSTGPGTITLTQGALQISDRLTIQGQGIKLQGAQPATPPAGAPVAGDRLINITDADAATVLTGLRLTGGGFFGDPGSPELQSGTAILSAADLTLRHVIVTGNGQQTGAYLGNAAVYSAQDLTIFNSAIVNNRQFVSGGVFAQGDLTIEKSRITDNASTLIGAAGAWSGDVTVRDSDLSRNHTGIWARYGDVTVEDSTIRQNEFGVRAYGGTATVTGSTISENTATSMTQGVKGGGLYAVDAVVTGSTLAENRITSESSVGAGIYVTETLTLLNTTVSSNVATGSVEASNAGIRARSAVVTHSTITSNVSTGQPVVASDTNAAGIAVTGSLTLVNSIVIGNLVSDGTVRAEDTSAATLTLTGGNIVGSTQFDGTDVVTDTVTTAIFSGSTRNVGGFGLRDARDNGGPVETLALSRFGVNPAVDTGDPGLPDLPSVDARGIRRGPEVIGATAAGPDLGAFELSAKDGRNQEVGTAGADVLGGNVSPFLLIGFGGNDTITGSNNPNLLIGGIGDDTLRARDGADSLFGNAGEDRLFGGRGEDTLFGGPGDDSASGEDGIDLIFGGAGDDLLSGGDEDDTIYGGPGADSITDASGADVLYGGGNDDEIDGGGASDLIYGGPGADSILGGVNDDWLFGGPGRDSLVGSNGSDTLYGGGGIDTLIGDGGGDTLFGGLGADVLEGGGGADRFHFDIGHGADLIVDLNAGLDRLVLTTALVAGRELADLTAEDGPDAVIDLGAGDSIRVSGATESELLTSILV